MSVRAKEEIEKLRERVRNAGDRLPDGDLAMLLCALNGERVRRFDINCGDDGSREFAVRGTGDYAFTDYRRSCPDVSIDAAIALCERTLPGHGTSIGRSPDGMAQAAIFYPDARKPPYWTKADREDGNRPLAILDALLSALLANPED